MDNKLNIQVELLNINMITINSNIPSFYDLSNTCRTPRK